MASSDPDLYPPDSSDRSPEARSARNRAFVGVFLVTWGSGLLAERATHTHLDYFGLSLGLGLLAAWNQWRRYPWFVAAAILTGSGIGGLLDSIMGGGSLGSAVHAFGTAAGFAACFVRYPTRSTWSLIPAGIFGVIGLGALGLGLAGLIGGHVAGFMLPGLVISAGILLVMKGSIPKKARRACLLVLAATFLMVASSSGFGSMVPGAVSVSRTVPFRLPDLADKTLVFEGGSDDVRIRTGEPASASVDLTTRGPSRHAAERRLVAPHLDPVTEGDEVVIRTGHRGFWWMDSADYTFTVPAGTNVKVVEGSGDIEAVLTTNPTLDVKTGSGDIRIDDEEKDGRAFHRAGAEGAGTLTFRTGSGDVSIELLQPAVAG